MTPTAIDAQIYNQPPALVRPANVDSWMAVQTPSEQHLQLCYDAFSAVQKLHGTTSKLRFADSPTSSLPETRDIISAFLGRFLKPTPAMIVQEPVNWDVEVELPPWKGPKGIRVHGIVRKVSRGTFRPITEDDIGGI